MFIPVEESICKMTCNVELLPGQENTIGLKAITFIDEVFYFRQHTHLSVYIWKVSIEKEREGIEIHFRLLPSLWHYLGWHLLSDSWAPGLYRFIPTFSSSSLRTTMIYQGLTVKHDVKLFSWTILLNLLDNLLQKVLFYSHLWMRGVGLKETILDSALHSC